MKSKFGVITFAASEMKPKEVVVREPNFSVIEAGLRESKKKIEMGRKLIAGFLATSVALLAAGLYIRKLKPIPVKTEKRFLK